MFFVYGHYKQYQTLILTRQQYISYSGFQEQAGTRRSLQAMVAPLAKAATPGQPVPETPNHLILEDRPSCAGLLTVLAKLAGGGLQRRFAALQQTGARRLNTTYIVAGLINSQGDA